MNGKKCKTCNACKRVYTKGHFRFWKERFCYCAEREEMTGQESVCEEWKKRKREYDLSPQRFDQAEEDIRFLCEYLKDT